MGLFRKSQKNDGVKSPGRKYVLKKPVAAHSDARNWWEDLATRKQLRYIAEFGTAAPETLTKGQAGEIIDELIAKFPKIAEQHERQKEGRAYDPRQALKEELIEATRQLSAARGEGNVQFWREEVARLKSAQSQSSGVFRLLLRIGVLLAGIVVVLLVVVAFTHRDHQAETSRPPAPPASVETPTALPKPSAPPSKTRSPSPVAPTARNAEEAKQLAVKYHPELGVSGSPLNTEFLARHKRYQVENPAFFSNPSWPIVLAEECIQSLRAQQSLPPR